MEFKELRIRSGMNKMDFSRYFNIPYQNVQRWESGERKCMPVLIELMQYKLEHEGKWFK